MKIPVSPFWAIPGLFIFLAGLSYTLHFNGLYGQDSYEYLRQCTSIGNRLQGLPIDAPNIGDAEIAGGYPLAGAITHLLTGLPVGTALQLVSLVSSVVALWLFERCLQVLAPGARRESRWVFGLLTLAAAPFALRAGLTVMSDAQGLALVLGVLYYVLRVLETERLRAVVPLGILAAFAVTTRYALGALFILPVVAVGTELTRNRQWTWLAAAVSAGIIALFPFWWLKMGLSQPVWAHSLLRDWSPAHLFQHHFTQASGTTSYTLPNILYVLYPICHPGFCLTLPALFLLAKRTDTVRYSRRILLVSLIAYLLFLGVIPHQNTRYLLPAYAVLLLLLFPAWDRFYAYGLYFFPRLAYALMGLTIACQLAFLSYYLRPILQRQILERRIAEALETRLPAGAEVFAFDLDIALNHYLPNLKFHNLWVQKYESFPAGSFFLFNEPLLRNQWSGQNPMRNWEYANAHFYLEEIQTLPEGWTLFRVAKPR